MYRILAIVVMISFLGACSSIEGPAEGPGVPNERSGSSLEIVSGVVEPSARRIDGSEDYRGPPVAAVAPVSNERAARDRTDDRLRADIQDSFQSQLDASGIFAGVVALDRPDEENEAEVIIEPALVGPSGYDRDHLELEVRVTEKTKRKVVLDEHYEGDDPTDVLKVAITELEDDLGDRYQR
jgi:hypothetical protein